MCFSDLHLQVCFSKLHLQMLFPNYSVQALYYATMSNTSQDKDKKIKEKDMQPIQQKLLEKLEKLERWVPGWAQARPPQRPSWPHVPVRWGWPWARHPRCGQWRWSRQPIAPGLAPKRCQRPAQCPGSRAPPVLQSPDTVLAGSTFEPSTGAPSRLR